MEALSRHRITIRGTLLFLALVLICLSAAAYAVNHSRLHDLLVQQLKTQIGIEVRTLSIQLFPTASIRVSDLLVRDAETAEPSLQADRAVLSIRLWPLMTRRVLLLTLEATEPQVVIRRDEGGRWHVPLLNHDTTDPPNDRADGRWSVTDMVLQDGTLRILDPARLEREGIA